jgi:flagellar motor switch protein FliN/FliY
MNDTSNDPQTEPAADGTAPSPAETAKPENAGPTPRERAAMAEAIGFDAEMTALAHVPVDVQIVLGRTRLPIGQILKLGRGAVVEIDRKVGEQVEIHLNHRPVARGEIVIVDDDRLGVTITEIVTAAGGMH